MRVLHLLRSRGVDATSLQLLEDGIEYWFDGDDACVDYADTGLARVAAGAPVAPPERVEETARRLLRAAAASFAGGSPCASCG